MDTRGNHERTNRHWCSAGAAGFSGSRQRSSMLADGWSSDTPGAVPQSPGGAGISGGSANILRRHGKTEVRYVNELLRAQV